MAERSGPLKIVRIIARLNVGGPAQQVVALTARLGPPQWASVLIAGRLDPSEGDFSFLADRQAVTYHLVPELQRAVHPWHDLVAWVKLCRLLAREHPAVVHTHTAKAGALGRLAGLWYRWRHPGHPMVLVHTFHGHVLSGYFGGPAARVFLAIERWLGRRTDWIIAVSEAVREELLRYGIGSPERVVVIPVGLPLEPLLALTPPPAEAGGPLRIAMVGRLVPIKQHELLLDAAQRLARSGVPFRAVIVGDGERRAALERQAQARGLHGLVEFAGWRFDLAAVYQEADCVCLTSLNEGTPLSLIEAMAACRPVVATAVGGVRDLLGPATAETAGARFVACERGLRVAAGDAEGLAEALQHLAQRPDVRRELGEAGRGYVRTRFTLDRLTEDLRSLYAAAVGGARRWSPERAAAPVVPDAVTAGHP